MRRIAVLGSTGSIGVNGLDVLRRLNRAGGGFRVSALSAHSNLGLLQKQIRAFRPRPGGGGRRGGGGGFVSLGAVT
jgi:1-deoxy-D-xylulose-5-phosphate reductoisomerase